MQDIALKILVLTALVAGVAVLAARFRGPQATATAADTTSAAQSGDDNSPERPAVNDDDEIEKITKTEEEWREQLTPEQYHITREDGTERAFSGKYWKTKTPGVYRCIGCGLSLFDSETKYASGSGWPSFWQPIDADHVATETDTRFGMRRTEVSCYRCDAHLGHVFEDGPEPTGLRYCINSAALDLEETEEK